MTPRVHMPHPGVFMSIPQLNCLPMYESLGSLNFRNCMQMQGSQDSPVTHNSDSLIKIQNIHKQYVEKKSK